jgi:hypothetical protein
MPRLHGEFERTAVLQELWRFEQTDGFSTVPSRLPDLIPSAVDLPASFRTHYPLLAFDAKVCREATAQLWLWLP